MTSHVSQDVRYTPLPPVKLSLNLDERTQPAWSDHSRHHSPSKVIPPFHGFSDDIDILPPSSPMESSSSGIEESLWLALDHSGKDSSKEGSSPQLSADGMPATLLKTVPVEYAGSVRHHHADDASMSGAIEPHQPTASQQTIRLDPQSPSPSQFSPAPLQPGLRGIAPSIYGGSFVASGPKTHAQSSSSRPSSSFPSPTPGPVFGPAPVNFYNSPGPGARTNEEKPSAPVHPLYFDTPTSDDTDPGVDVSELAFTWTPFSRYGQEILHQETPPSANLRLAKQVTSEQGPRPKSMSSFPHLDQSGYHNPLPKVSETASDWLLFSDSDDNDEPSEEIDELNETVSDPVKASAADVFAPAPGIYLSPLRGEKVITEAKYYFR